MDAVEFLKIMRRYLNDTGLPAFKIEKDTEPEVVIERLESWAKRHPIKTRQSEFLKHYPDALIDDNGALEIAPCFMNKEYYERMDSDRCGHYCEDCRKEYWLEEIE